LNAEYYDSETMDQLSARFGAAGLDDDMYVSSPASSVSYRSDSSSPSSQLSGYSTPASDCSSCTCERYGITRKGERVLLDCGGSRCGYDSESCSDSEDEEYECSSSRRHGMIVN
jgi:hypothetical protein